MNLYRNGTISKPLHRLSLWLAIAIACSSGAFANTNPIVSVTVNGTSSTTIFRGMPMLVSIWLVHPAAMSSTAEPILIAGKSGAWTNSIQFDVTDASGQSQSWPFQTTAIASNTITLDSTTCARIDRWLTPAQTQVLSTGHYSLAATLNTTNVIVAGAWQGFEPSVPADVTVQDEPVPLSEANAENKYSQLAEYYLFRGDPASSLAQANVLLALFPTNITARRLQAQALAANGQAEQAEFAVSQALNEVYARDPNPKEPPRDLYNLSRELQQQRLASPKLGITRTNQQAQLTWAGYSDFFYWIETSTDLQHWSFLATNAFGGAYSFPVSPSVDHQYYRIGRAEMDEVMAPPFLQFASARAQFALSWFGYPWFNYKIEVSSNLATWSLLATNFNVVGNTYSFTVEPGSGRQFYRIIH
jgi:hypothetical protein